MQVHRLTHTILISRSSYRIYSRKTFFKMPFPSRIRVYELRNKYISKMKFIRQTNKNYEIREKDEEEKIVRGGKKKLQNRQSEFIRSFFALFYIKLSFSLQFSRGCLNFSFAIHSLFENVNWFRYSLCAIYIYVSYIVCAADGEGILAARVLLQFKSGTLSPSFLVKIIPQLFSSLSLSHSFSRSSHVFFYIFQGNHKIQDGVSMKSSRKLS